MASKKRLATARRLMTATGGGQGEVSITDMDDRIHVIIGDVGIATEDVPLDSDLLKPACADTANRPDS